jgi:hypothetical protein
MSLPMISKAAARYTGAGGKEHCSLCRHFSPRRGGRCARVLGDISPMGWCKLFSREMRGMVADASSFNGGGGGPSLSLDFMTPGTLSPLITFTRASTATYFDSAGVLRSAAINTPRWDYDPVTLAMRGLLLEDQRTNGIRNSSDMSAVVPGTPGAGPVNWSYNAGTTGLTVQTVGAGVESGISYVDIRFSGTVTAAAGTVIVQDSAAAIVAATGQAWTYSHYWRLVSGTATGMTTSQVTIRENTSAGGLVKDNPLTIANPTSATLSGQRVSAGIALSGGATVARVQARIAINYANGALVDMTLRIGAPQLEAGDFATSYIPTTAAAVTRSIDSCLIPPANMGWFTGPGGSWFAEFDYFDVTPSNSRVIGRPDTAGGVSPLLLNATRNVAQNDGVTLATANATTAGVVAKACSTWAAGSARICANGGAVASSASLATGYGAFTAAGIRFLSVGAALGADNTSGHIRAVRYWPTVLTDAQMQAITAP